MDEKEKPAEQKITIINNTKTAIISVDAVRTAMGKIIILRTARDGLR